MLPGLHPEARQPLNPVSNTTGKGGGGVVGAMQKLASEKAARKAKSSAAAIMLKEASGVGAVIGTQGGGVVLKTSSFPPGMSWVCLCVLSVGVHGCACICMYVCVCVWQYTSIQHSVV